MGVVVEPSTTWLIRNRPSGKTTYSGLMRPLPRGLRHQLLVLANLSRALREEELKA
jgi:hypothetical protein